MKMMREYKYIPLLLFMILSLLEVKLYAQDEWTLEKVENGIEIYLSEKPDSKIKQVKAVAHVNASIKDILTLLRDFEAYPSWSSAYKEVEILNDSLENEYVVHSRVALPWPLDDRDFIYRLRILTQKDGTTIMEGRVFQNNIPEQKGVVRMTVFETNWLLTPTNTGTTLVSQGHAEPNVSVPAWVVNLFLVNAPLKDITTIKKLVEPE